MTSASTRRSPALRLLLSLVLTGWLVACGPGVEGTGTGATDDPLKSFGATAVSVCGSALAPQLAGCVKGQTLHYADAATLPRVTADVQDGHIELQAHCAGMKFSGDWAAIGDQPPRFYGTVTSATGTVLATLVASSAGPASLQVELRDQLDQRLLGPLTLIPADASAVIANCS